MSDLPEKHEKTDNITETELKQGFVADEGDKLNGPDEIFDEKSGSKAKSRSDSSESELSIVCSMGEIALKGRNRGMFEKALRNNIRMRLKPIGDFKISVDHSRIIVSPLQKKTAEMSGAENSESKADPVNMAEADLGDVKLGDVKLAEANIGDADPAADNLSHVEKIENIERALAAIKDCFGLVSFSIAESCPANPLDLANMVRANALRTVAKFRKQRALNESEVVTFKFESSRSNKRYPMKSYEISAAMGAVVLKSVPNMKVDVNHPDICFKIRVMDKIFLSHEALAGRRGLPTGTGGKVLVLLSGGIDSPVAAYRMASRGLKTEFMYFHTFPYTSDKVKQKTEDLAMILSGFTGHTALHTVDFTKTQLALSQKCPEEMITVIMRRMMMRIADIFCEKRGIKAIVTGESLGQVASQTLEALVATDSIAKRPVFRPLIGCDKEEIVILAKDIGTYETSILPYEDCCTVFVSKHPRTRPKPEDVLRAEAEFEDLDEMARECVENKIETLLLPQRIVRK